MILLTLAIVWSVARASVSVPKPQSSLLPQTTWTTVVLVGGGGIAHRDCFAVPRDCGREHHGRAGRAPLGHTLRLEVGLANFEQLTSIDIEERINESVEITSLPHRLLSPIFEWRLLCQTRGLVLLLLSRYYH
jgi:hypothetical protein